MLLAIFSNFSISLRLYYHTFFYSFCTPHLAPYSNRLFSLLLAGPFTTPPILWKKKKRKISDYLNFSKGLISNNGLGWSKFQKVLVYKFASCEDKFDFVFFILWIRDHIIPGMPINTDTYPNRIINSNDEFSYSCNWYNNSIFFTHHFQKITKHNLAIAPKKSGYGTFRRRVNQRERQVFQ